MYYESLLIMSCVSMQKKTFGSDIESPRESTEVRSCAGLL